MRNAVELARRVGNRRVGDRVMHRLRTGSAGQRTANRRCAEPGQKSAAIQMVRGPLKIFRIEHGVYSKPSAGLIRSIASASATRAAASALRASGETSL